MDLHSSSVSLWSLPPFVLMLGSIAVFPLFWNHFWERNGNKLIVALTLSVPVIIYLFSAGLTDRLVETMVFDYIPFIILLGSLFTITGGIVLTGDIEARPLINTVFLGSGAVLASLMGTTGAAMLLIRPVIQTNAERRYKVHTILFFIAIVANCGGLLTPLGDPPLFVMYLRGAPFTWFFGLFIPWAIANGLLLLIYFIVDSYFYKKESSFARMMDKTYARPMAIDGTLNFLWLAGVVLAVAFLNSQYLHFIGDNEYFTFTREAAILLLACLSLRLTTQATRVSNRFTWEPIKEVAYLFLGIFVTMVPGLLYLEYNATHLGVVSAKQFYYFSGLLSSFLDNTPTAVTFHALALGLGNTTGTLVAGIPDELLRAICLGAVLFGSMTYIGNGPNFMVKAVAEENDIEMPHFFAYLYSFSLIVLLPIFVLLQWLVLSP